MAPDYLLACRMMVCVDYEEESDCWVLNTDAGITVLWALAAALVPEMQKGNESARNAHIALNVLNVLLFIWQIPTGWEIVEKVFQFTTWP
jgi:hypothetical protein